MKPIRMLLLAASLTTVCGNHCAAQTEGADSSTQQAIEQVENKKKRDQAMGAWITASHKNGPGSEVLLQAAQSCFDAVIAANDRSTFFRDAYVNVIEQLFACGRDDEARAIWEKWKDDRMLSEFGGVDWLELTRIRSIGASSHPSLKMFSFDALIRANPKALLGYWGKLIRCVSEAKAQAKLSSAEELKQRSRNVPSKSTKPQPESPNTTKIRKLAGENAYAALAAVDICAAGSKYSRFLGPVDGKLHPEVVQCLFKVLASTPDFPKAKAQLVYDRLLKSSEISADPAPWAPFFVGAKQKLDTWGQPGTEQNCLLDPELFSSVDMRAKFLTQTLR